MRFFIGPARHREPELAQARRAGSIAANKAIKATPFNLQGVKKQFYSFNFTHFSSL
jgi:hypothetical protein